MSKLLASLSLFVVLVASAPALAVQHPHSTVDRENTDVPVVTTVAMVSADKPESPSVHASNSAIRVYAGQLTTTALESPRADSVVRISNRARTESDIDFIAFDQDGNEYRHTEVVPPMTRRFFRLGDVFPNLNIDAVSVEIRAAARPPALEAKTAALLPVAFFSQRNSAWASNQLGTCTGTTIGSAGCAISSIAMAGARSVTNFNPATLNSYLTQNGGYSGGCNVRWASPANIDGTGGFTYIGSGGTVTSAAKLKGIIDANRFAVVRSYRFSGHYAVIIGYNGNGTQLSNFVYLDPWDLNAVYRYVGDGRVTTTSSMQIYQ